MTDSEWRYCPRCANDLVRKEMEGKQRPVCEACGFIHFADPKVTVGVLIKRGERVLLGKRSIDPQRGLWCLPGGFVDYGERVRDAAAREALEETRLVIKVGELLGVWDFDGHIGGKEGIAIFFRGLSSGGEAVAADDLAEVGWFLPGALPPMAFPLHEMVVKTWAQGQQGG